MSKRRSEGSPPSRSRDRLARSPPSTTRSAPRRKAPNPSAVRTAAVWFPGRKSPAIPWRRGKGASAGRRTGPPGPVRRPPRPGWRGPPGGSRRRGSGSGALRSGPRRGRRGWRQGPLPPRSGGGGGGAPRPPPGSGGRPGGDLPDPEEGEEGEEEGRPSAHRHPGHQGPGAEAGSRVKGRTASSREGRRTGGPLRAHPHQGAGEPQRHRLEEVDPEDRALGRPQAPEDGHRGDSILDIDMDGAGHPDPPQEEGHEPHQPKEAGQVPEPLGQDSASARAVRTPTPGPETASRRSRARVSGSSPGGSRRKARYWARLPNPRRPVP
jgi:hypothetical protein